MKRAWTTLRLIVAASAVTASVTLPARGDYLTFDIASHEAMADYVRFESRSWAENAEGEGGRLAANMVWSGDEHVIVSDIYIPSGVTLTINAGTVVKFREGTRIKVEDGGSLVINGASGNEVVLEGYDYDTRFTGIVLQSSAASYSDNSFVIVRGFNFGRYATVSLNNTTAFLGGGQALVPVDVSGSRDTAFSFDWVAETNGVTFASGTMNWNRVSDGRKNITVPYPDGLPGCNNFVVRAVTFRCCSPNASECVVTLSEFITTDIFSHEAMADYIAFESREWAVGMEGEGGRLATNATWSGTHKIVSDVYIPSGVTLTLAADTVVEFCEGTRIKIEDGGTLNIVGADGHDVILRGAEGVANFGGIVKMPNGTFTDNSYFRFEGFTYGALANVALHDSSTFRSSGLALIPVTVSGSRSTAFSIDWVTETNGVPYKTGTLKWNGVSDGTKNISINYGAELDGYTNFTLRTAVDRACKTSPNTCTIKISDFIVSDIASHESMAEYIRFESREWAADLEGEGGRLAANATWEGTHKIASDVYIPSGVTLTLAADAVVEFYEGTRIKIEDGGALNIVGANGHDVIIRGAEGVTNYVGVVKMPNGTYKDNMYVQYTDRPYSAYPYITVHEATTYREAGKMWVAFSLSGTTRNQSFNVDWSTDKGDSGTLTWSSSSDGTKWIEIPIAAEPIGGTTNHAINITAARGCNISVGTSVLTVLEPDYNAKGQVALTEGDAQSNDFAVNGGIKTQPLFLNDTETVQYSGKWQPYDENEAAVLRVTLETDNGATVLKEASPSETGAFDLDLKQYPVGYYTLKHEILNDLGETLATMQKTFSIADDEDVVLHGGVLTSNEVWAADKVHVVYETVVVPSVYTIFIEPDAIVKFMTGTGIDISQGGAFFANRIVFTHINDDTVGGDTLNDGFTVAPPMDAYFLSGAFTFGDDTELRGITQNNALTGTIATQKTLSRGSTYRVSGTLTIASGGSLTIPPGTVLKMENKAAIVVNSGATLNAVGTRAAPITFTSIKDDTISGDTNGDGSNTIPQPGDWNMIKCSGGTINMEYVNVLYGGKSNNDGGDVFSLNGGKIVFNESVMAHAFMYGVALESGTWAMTNSVFCDFHTAFRHFASCDCVNSVFYDMTYLSNNGGQNFKNCVIAGFATALCWWADNCTYQNCVIWNPEGFGPQDSEKTGANGNIWGDPLFVDPANGDFRVKEGSPCVDAADGSVAPELDFYGQPRITITDHGDELVGQLADIGVCEVMPRDVVSDIDLVPQSVRTTTNAVPGQLLFVKWEIANVGGREVEAAWRDTVSLVSESGREVVLGVKTTSSRIGVGGSVFCSGYFTVPAVAEGTWYPKVNVNSYHDIFEGSLAANNALTGERAVAVGLEALDPSIAREGVINGGTPTVLKLAYGEDAENRMVKFDVPAGVKATWGFGFMPGGSRSGASGSMTASGDGVMFRVPDGATDVYVVLESDTTTTYNLSTESTQMTITGVTPATLPSSGTTTLTITGAGFGEGCEVSLVNAFSIIHLPFNIVDANTIIATVDCAEPTIGSAYLLRVEKGDKSTELVNAVTVAKVEGKGLFWASIEAAESVRHGRGAICKVRYGNSGNADVPAQVLQITLDVVKETEEFILAADTSPAKTKKNMMSRVSLLGDKKTDGFLSYVGDSLGHSTLQFLATGDTECAGVIKAGAVYEIMFVYTPGSPSMGYEERLRVRTSVGQTYAPEGWDSAKDYLADLATAATRAGRLGMDATDFQLIFDWAKKIRDGIVFSVVSGCVVDSDGEPASEVPLVIGGNDGRIAYIKSGKDGTFVFDGLTTNGVFSIYGDASQVIGAEEIALTPGLDISGLSLVADSRINCRLKVEGFTLPFRVEVINTQQDKSYPFFESSDGTFYMKGLPDGLYSVKVEDESGGIWRNCFVVDTDLFQQTLVAEKQSPCSIRGSFIPPNGDDVCFAVLSAPGIKMVQNINFETQGFSFDHLSPGYYCVSVMHGTEQAMCEEILGAFLAVSGEDVTIGSIGAMSNASAKQKNYLLGKGNKYYWFDPDAAMKIFLDYLQEFETMWNSHKPQPPTGDYNCPHNQALYQSRLAGWASYSSIINDYRSGATKTSGWRFIAELCGFVHDAANLTFDAVLEYYTKPAKTAYQTAINGLVGTMAGLVKDGLDKYLDPEEILEFNEIYEAVKIGANVEDIGLSTAQHITQLVRKFCGKRGGGRWGYNSAVGKRFDIFSKMNTLWTLGEDLAQCVARANAVWNEIQKLDRAMDDMERLTMLLAQTRANFESVMGSLSDYPLCCQQCFPDPVYEPPEGEDRTKPRTSYDPNEMVGSLGVGDPETQRFVKPGEELTYTIYFENKTNATAAAQEVYVTNPLSEWLDWSTFKMHEVAFGDQIDLGLADKGSGASEVMMKGTNFVVRTEVVLEENGDAGTRDACPYQARWYMRIVDPTTDTGWPTDVVAGFLPPNDETHRGEGHITYSICVRADAPANLVISNSADIVFDHNPSIKTDPAWWNTVAPTTGNAKFNEAIVETEESSNAVIRVAGGNLYTASSVKVYLTYNTAVAADLDLAKGEIDGVAPKGGLKFPLTLKWAAGEIGEKTITIPVKADKTVEDDEFFTLQLAEAEGMELGEARVCTVTIRDMNDKTLKAAVSPYRPKKGESVTTNSVTVAGTAGGFVAGTGEFTSGSKLTLAAEARPGWAFAGWTLKGGDGSVLSDKAKWQVAVTNDAEYVAVFEKIPYIRGLADPADGGKVSGSGYCAAGKKVTLKATAGKNHAFVGWLESSAAIDSGREPSTAIEYIATTPTLVIDRTARPAKDSKTLTTITDVAEDVTYFAVFRSYPKVTVSVEDTDGKGAASTGRGAGRYVAGTITGEGKYAPGKKVTLKATANKNYVFAGWVDARGGIATQTAGFSFAMPSNDVEYVAKFVTADEDKDSITVVIDGSALEPWVSKSETNALATNIWAGVYLEWPVAAGALSEPKVKVSGLPAGLKFTDKPVTSKIGTGKTAVTVTNVPANTIYGAPTAASKIDTKTGAAKPSAVKVTVTTTGKSSQTYQIDTVVDALPSWAQGTFAGGAVDGGQASLTVSAAGKISGKVLSDGLVYTLAAPYYSSFETAADISNFVASVTANWSYKEGAKTVKTNDVVRLVVQDNGIGGCAAVEDWMEAYTVNWKIEPWKTLGKSFDRNTLTYAILADGAVSESGEDVSEPLGDYVTGRVTLKFAASGSVTVSGEFVTGYNEKTKEYTTVRASGSATLVPVTEEQCAVFIYLTPKGLPPHARSLEVPWP